MIIILCPGHPCPICRINYGCIDNMGAVGREPYEKLKDGNLKTKCVRGYGTPRECITHYEGENYVSSTSLSSIG